MTSARAHCRATRVSLPAEGQACRAAGCSDRHRTRVATPLVMLIALGVFVTVAGCKDGHGGNATKAAAAPQGALITLAESTLGDVPVVLESIGKVESRISTEIAAEVDGRVLRLAADAGDAVTRGQVVAEIDPTQLRLERQAAEAEIRRVQAEIANTERRVRRFEELQRKGYLSGAQLDDTQAQLDMLREQLDAGQARRGIVADQLARSTVRAPLSGQVEQRRVSAGDYVKRGDPLFLVTGGEGLRALLPFPETVAAQIKPGLAVTLTSPVAPGSRVRGTITELRPMVGKASRAVWAIVDMTNPGGWRPDATVVGEVVVAVRRGAVLVPDASVVRRPAGEVVYVIRDGRARQQVVTLGERRDGRVEIVSGLAAGEPVAAEGAAYLTDGALVRQAQARP